MNVISILLVVVAIIVLGLLVVQGIRAVRYARSDEWRMQQRMRRYLQHEAE